MTDKLTRKQKVFVETYLETGVGAIAAKKAYDIGENEHQLAASIASENLRKPEIERIIREALGDDKLQEKHFQLLNAVTLEKVYFDEYDEDELIKEVIDKMPGYELLHIVTRLDKEGSVTSKYAYVKAPDNNTQDKALDKAYKVTGRYAPEKHLNLNISTNTPNEKVKALAKSLNARR